MNFLSKTLPAFGLNLSGSAIKIMQMEKKGQDLAIKSYHSSALPPETVVNESIVNEKNFNAVLKKALEQPQFGRISTNYVIASLPESKSFVRVIQMPQMSAAEAENAVPFEAESFIPLPIDQVYLDWQQIGVSGDKMNILIVASPKDFAEKYLEILDRAGLVPVALEVESQSIQRALSGVIKTDNTLLARVGTVKTTMIMIEEGNLQFTSTIPVAGNSFTESIARALGVSNAKAEEIKKKVGIANTVEYPNITTSLLPVLNNLAEEIKNVLKFHGEHSEKQVSKVMLLGGASRLKNLPEFLTPQLQASGIINVELANPWKNLPKFKASPLSAEEALSYITAMGLAMRGIDFEL